MLLQAVTKTAGKKRVKTDAFVSARERKKKMFSPTNTIFVHNISASFLNHILLGNISVHDLVPDSP